MPITDQAGQRLLGLPSATANNEPVTLGQITDGSLALTVSSLSLTTPLPVASGGTGAATASAARTNLSAAKSGANTDITSLALTTPLSVAQGGTGSATASGARTNLAAAASGANSDITSMSGFTGLLDLSNSAAGQIKFPATQNASTDANTLDDYQEGTISGTPTAGSGTFTSASYSGSYTKIGSVCQCSIRVDIVDQGTAAGTVVVPLPFNATASSAAAGREIGATGWALQGTVDPSSNSLYIGMYNNAFAGISGYVLIVSIAYQV